jgi:hypothetical protein
MNRLVHINPVEPAMFSGRAPMGFDLTINITYRTAADAKWSTDVASSVILTGRTDSSSTTYNAPAVDIVNGKARAVIPGGDLSDSNGYDIALVGTIDGHRQILASGVLQMTGGGVQEIILTDEIDTVDLTFGYGNPASFDVTLWQDADGSISFDPADAGVTIAGRVLNAKGGTILVEFSQEFLSDNVIRLSLTSAQVDALPASCWWTLTAGTATGVTTLCQGTVTITGP